MLRSRLTRRSQTTLPSGVRDALELQPGADSIEWEIRGNEAVARRASATVEEDPALQPFLDLLEQDIQHHPERLRGMPRSLRTRLRNITAGVPVPTDDEPIEGTVAI